MYYDLKFNLIVFKYKYQTSNEKQEKKIKFKAQTEIPHL